MVICFEKRGLYTDEEEEKVEGLFSSGTFDWSGVGRMQEIQAAWQVTR